MPPFGGSATIGIENHKTGLRPWKCTPIPAFGGTSPRESMSLDSQVAALPYESSSFATPEGEVLAMLCIAMLMSSEAERRAKSPLRGEGGTEGTKRGAFPSPVGRLACFPSSARAIVWFYHKRALSFFIAPHHHPLNPLNQPASREALINS